MNGSSFVKIMAVSVALAGCSATGTITSGSDASPVASGASATKGSATAAAQGEVLRYTRAMKTPMALEIQALNGAVHASLSPSDAAEVRANKTVKSGNPASQRVVVSERPEATLVCVLYADEPDGACAPGHVHRGDHDDDDDVRIDFELRVPAGVVLRANTLNGDIEATSLQSEIRAHTLNGALQLSSTARIVGNTLNGNIVATALGPGEPDIIDLATNNGEIELRLADRASFDIDASTLSGQVTSDYPLPPVASAFGPSAVRGPVAGGGAALRMRTLNGNIQVRRVQ